MNTYYMIRKMGHVTIYFILTILVIRGLKESGIKKRIYIYLVAFIFSILYALSDEYHQSLTGFRDGRLMDVGIDGIGVLVGIYTSYIKLYLNKNNLIKWLSPFR